MGAANFGANPNNPDRGFVDPAAAKLQQQKTQQDAKNDADFWADKYGAAKDFGSNLQNIAGESAGQIRHIAGREADYLRDIGEIGFGIGQDANQALQGFGDQANLLSGQLGQRATDVMGRQGDYSAANLMYGAGAHNAANLAQLEAMQGPSAAQAQLQSGLNAAQSSNLALARSGRGWGGNAQALAQAQGQNAAMGAQAANQAAMLRAQEDAAWRARQAQNLAGAAGLQTNLGAQQQAQAYNQMALNDQTMLGLTDQQRQSLMGAGSLYGQGAGLGLAGNQQSFAAEALAGQQLLGAESGASQLELGALQNAYGAQTGVDALQMQKYGIDQGVAVANNQANMGLLGAGLSAGGALLGTLLMPGPGTVAGAAIGNGISQAAR